MTHYVPISQLSKMAATRLEIQSGEYDSKNDGEVEKLRWNKLSPHDLTRYHNDLESAILSSASPLDGLSCHGQTHCTLDMCPAKLQEEYDVLICALLKADSSLPRQQKGREKSWWSSELSALKCQSIDIQKLWISQGRPGNGPVHQERLRVRAAYKRALRKAQKRPNQDSLDRLHIALETCDSNSFWHSWKSLHNKDKSNFAPVVEGCTSKPAIANAFKEEGILNQMINLKLIL